MTTRREIHPLCVCPDDNGPTRPRTIYHFIRYEPLSTTVCAYWLGPTPLLHRNLVISTGVTVVWKVFEPLRLLFMDDSDLSLVAT